MRISSLTNETGTTLDDDLAIATNFNTFFASVFTRENNHEVPKPDDMGILEDNVCADIQFDDKDVLKVLDKLRADKSPGPDELFPRLLLEIKDEIAYPLFVLFVLQCHVTQCHSLSSCCFTKLQYTSSSKVFFNTARPSMRSFLNCHWQKKLSFVLLITAKCIAFTFL